MNRRILLAALVLALSLIAAVLLAYFVKFHDAAPSTHGDWGAFGDYFAGLLNPIFSLLAFCALMYSLVLRKRPTHPPSASA